MTALSPLHPGIEETMSAEGMNKAVVPVNDAWAEAYCALVNRDPDGLECKVVEGIWHETTFRDIAKREIEAMLSAAPLGGGQADLGSSLRDTHPAPSFQSRVVPWLMECFGGAIASDWVERCDRFIEEALELAQSLGWPKERALALVEYVYGRPAGEPHQEVGGAMVTLAALCWAAGLDMQAGGDDELARIMRPEIVQKIRAKQAAKPTGSALPIAMGQAAVSPASQVGARAVDEAELQDAIDTAIADSLDQDWRTGDGARAVVRYFGELGWSVVESLPQPPATNGGGQ